MKIRHNYSTVILVVFESYNYENMFQLFVQHIN
jgi:hypothetical protein